MYLILNKKHFTFHLQCKQSGTFANRKYEELPYPKSQKMRDAILVTLLKMRPHNSQSSRKNATPYCGTSPLASYEEVPTDLPTLTALPRVSQFFVISHGLPTWLSISWFFGKNLSERK